MCTPLAVATALLIFSQVFAPGCMCIRGCSDFVYYYCIIVLICILPLSLLSTMSTSYFHSPTSLSACIVLLYYWFGLSHWFILFTCIIMLFASPLTVYSEYRFISLLHTHMSACVCTSLAGRTICLCVIVCNFAYCYWHWHLFLVPCIDISYWSLICFHNCWGQSPLPSPL